MPSSNANACHGGKERPQAGLQDLPPAAARARPEEDMRRPATRRGRAVPEVKFKHPARACSPPTRASACLACHPGAQVLCGWTAYAPPATPTTIKARWTATARVCHNGRRLGEDPLQPQRHGLPADGRPQGLECGDCHRDMQTFRITPRPSSLRRLPRRRYRSSPFPHAAYGAGRDCQECHMQDTWSYAHSPFWFDIQTGLHGRDRLRLLPQDAGDYREYTCHDCHKGHTGDQNGRCLDCHPGGFPDGGGGGLVRGADRAGTAVFAARAVAWAFVPRRVLVDGSPRRPRRNRVRGPTPAVRLKGVLSHSIRLIGFGGGVDGRKLAASDRRLPVRPPWEQDRPALSEPSLDQLPAYPRARCWRAPSRTAYPADRRAGHRRLDRGRGQERTLGRFFPDFDYTSIPVMEGGSAGWEGGGFSSGRGRPDVRRLDREGKRPRHFHRRPDQAQKARLQRQSRLERGPLPGPALQKEIPAGINVR